MSKQMFSKTSFPHQQTQNNVTQFRSQQPKKRAKHITGLHSEFQQLKKKIRDVQSKNQKIIEKIHSAFNFKKKGVYVQDESDEDQIYQEIESQRRHQQPLVLLNYQTMPDHRQIKIDSNADFRLSKNTNNDYRSKNFKSSGETGIENVQSSGFSIRSKSPRTPQYNNVKQQTHSAAQFQSNGRAVHLESLLKIQKSKVNQLMKKLQMKEHQYYKLQNLQQKFRAYAQNAKIVIESQLSTFLQTYVRNNMMGIQKACKRNQIRLMNLVMGVKQSNQQRKSAKIIRDHKNRRSQSRSLRKIDQKNSKADLSKSQVKKEDSTKKNKEFQEIALKYEQIIKNKNDEIEILDKKLKQKDLQISEFRIKFQALNKKLRDQQRKNNELYNSSHGKNTKQSTFDEQLQRKVNQQQHQINQERAKSKALALRLQELQQFSNQKDTNIKSLKDTISNLQIRISSLQNAQKKSQYANKVVEKLQREVNQKNNTLNQLIQKNGQAQKRQMERECEIYGLSNKLNKVQQILEMKERKIQELQRLLNNHEDILDRSLVMDHSMTMSKMQSRAQDLKKLFQDNQRLQEQISSIRNQNFTLVKQKEYAQTRINQLEQKNASLKKQIQLIEEENEIKSFRSSNFQNAQQTEEERRRLQQQVNQLSEKCNSQSKSIQNLRNQNLELNSKIMKAQNELQFVKQNVQQKDYSLQKSKKEIESLRDRIMQLEKVLSQNQCELEIEKKSYQQRIQELQNKWKQFQENMQAQPGVEFLDARSERTSVNNMKNNYNYLATHNELLSEKLRDAQAQIETQNMMQEKIIEAYNLNVEKVKTELKEKCSLIEKLAHELQKSKKKVIILQAREKQDSNNYEQNLNERIQQLEQQLRETKQINTKLTDMSNELFEQMKMKQQERQDVLKEVEFKSKRIQQLQQILQAKQIPFASRVSSKSRPKEVYQSQISQNNMSQSHSFLPNEGTIDFDLSVQHSFIDNSHLNVSQLFREMPHDKLKLRKRQHKLFEKTASYIASLKQVIEDKNKRIRILQKKIESLKSSQLVRKDYDFAGKNIQQQHDVEGLFKDYESVDFDRRRGSHKKKYKMLENDTKLVVQQNNMLVQQIESLNEELERAQQQQNSLVKIKDLYKDQIKKLIKKNQEASKAYDQQLAKQRSKIQNSESVHNFQALKQLFIKIFSVILVNEGGKKQQQKKKALQQYLKAATNILKIPQSEKDSLIQKIRSSG